MTYHYAKLRSAMTAIAAVFALSSTPLLAQDTGPAPAKAAPVAEPDPLAPEPNVEPAPTATEAVTETAAEPPPAPRPKVETARAEPKAATRRAAATARSSAARSSAPPTAAPAPIATPATEEQIDAPVAAPPDAASVAVPVTTPAVTAPLNQAQEMDERLELAGAAGAGLLALTGAGMALRRRKRRREEQRLEDAKWAIIEAAPDVETEAEAEPAFTRTSAPMHDSTPAEAPEPAQAHGPATKLPDGFDVSRFGPHVRAAYRGPTPDNPSVSLEYRLRRAGVLDRLEQDAAEAAARAARLPKRGNWESRPDADFLFRRGGAKNSAKPEFQR